MYAIRSYYVNVEKKGVVTAALVGTENFDVTRVDVSSLSLAGVAPIHVAVEDVTAPYYPFRGKEGELDCVETGSDGYPDLRNNFV